MLPSVGYFKSILCPYLQDDFCDRPYCQFRHEHLPAKQPKTLSAPKIEEPGSSKGLPTAEKSSALEEIVSEAVKRVLKENGQLLESLDASKIMELVGQSKLVEKVVENLVPRQAAKKPETTNNNGKNKTHKTYSVPKGIPAYTPTPIAVLKKTAHEPSKAKSSKSDGYEPTCTAKQYSTDTYEPNTNSQVSGYNPTKLSSTYTPSSITPTKDTSKDSGSSNISVSDGYFPSEIKYDPGSLYETQSVTYEPSKSLNKSEESYSPSTSEKVCEVEYKPSCKETDQPSDTYTPSSTLSCDVDYQPTLKELNSAEPSYSPYCPKSMASSVNYSPSSIKYSKTEATYSPVSTSSNRTQVNYAPSSIKALTTEPTYSPVSTSQNRPHIEYIPSSAGPPLSPEKYLALLEGLDDTLETEPPQRSDDEKNKERQKDKEREKERQRRKEKEREREKRKSSSSRSSESKSKSSSRHSSSSSSKRHKSSSDSKSSKSKDTTEVQVSRDEDLESTSDVDDECYRIFKEYTPAAGEGQSDDKKKRKSEEVPPPISEAIIPVKKQRIAHVASAEAPPRAIAAAKPPQRLSPGMAMLERYKKAQELRAAAATTQPTPVSPFGSSSGTEKKRIAHVPNVMGFLSNKPKATSASSVPALASSSSLSKPQLKPQLKSNTLNGRSAISNNNNKPAPVAAKVPRPTIAIETNCRVPASIRQRYLNILCDETLKIYDREQDAYDRAVEEEKQAYAKCNSKVVYINVITNLVQKIRREAEGSGNKAPATSQVERKTMSHSAMLAGKGGATVSWSIEKPRAGKVDTSLLKGASLYKLLERYVLTMEQQDIHGYPRPDPNERGKAVINTTNRYRQKPAAGINLGPDERTCDRCGKIYRVNHKGLAVREDDSCTYHWGRQFYRRGEARYTCCQGDGNSEGCSVGTFHVTDTGNLDSQKGGYVRTMTKSPASDGNYGVYALDCEMCYTTEGPELTRVTVVSSDNQTVYETLVKPDNPILDYNTRFSGISEEDLLNVKTTIRDVQAVLLSKFSNKTILIGHSFDSDLRALKIIHDTVIDTSVVFPHPKGLPFKKALRTLCGEILQKIIQNDVGGHDSAEDAIACMELMLWKVKQDLKLMKA